MAVSLGALGLVVAVGLYVTSRRTGSGVDPQDVAVIRNYAAAASVNGPILPGVSGVGQGEGTDYRSGETPSGPEVEKAVEGLKAVSDEGEAKLDALFWLATAKLAAGDLGMAQFYLQQVGAADDPRFLKLGAILSYRQSRLPDVEQQLRTVLEKNPNDAEAEFNLGLVCWQRAVSSRKR